MGLFSSLLSPISGLIQMGQSNKAHDIYGEGLTTGYNALQQGLTGTENRIQPTAQIGTDTISNLNSILNQGDISKFYDNPAYQYALSQAQRGIQAKAASHGSLMSGNTLKELQKNASGLASENYGSYIQNLSNLFNQASPYLSQYNSIPNLRGQNQANFSAALGSNSANAHLDKGNIESGIVNGIGNGLDSFINPFGSSGSSLMGNGVTGLPGMDINSGVGASPWGASLSNAPLQYGQNYGFKGFQ